ncbi:MAG: hypothetical protein AAFX81_18115 [Pseudomonadota bacterium]
MSIEALAASAVSALSPYVAAAGGKLATKLSDDAAGGLIALWEWVKGKVDTFELNKFEKAPDDAKAQGALETALEKRLSAHPDLVEDLRKLVEAAAPEAARIEQTIQTMTLSGGSQGAQIEGDGNTVKFNRN